jgi:DNA-binding GntR family transcriptional regulator
MDLSRGTVRAALHRLVTEGLVVQRPYAGWEVASLTSRDAWELYALRGALEALAARLAAENMDARKRSGKLLKTLEKLARSLGLGKAMHRRDFIKVIAGSATA